MAVLDIGRAFTGLDVDAASARWAGRALSLTGDLYLGSVAAANRRGTAAAVRDRLMALVDSRDELVVPVTFSEDTTVDGWYRLDGASVDYNAATLNDGYLSWSADLTRVGEGAMPQVEVVSSYGVITNGWSVTNTTLNSNKAVISGAPSTAYDGSNGYRGPDGGSRVAETGTLNIFAALSGVPASPGTVIHRWSIDPDDAYIGGCSLVGTYAGLSSVLCLGRGMTPAAEGMIVSNGIVRATIASGVLKVQAYDSGSWVNVGPLTWVFTISDGGSPSTLAWSQTARVTVLRNSPEEVSVRLLGASNLPAKYGRVWVDLTVKRGHRIVFVTVRSDVEIFWTVDPSTATACTNISGGMRQTNADASGNRFVLTGGQSVTSNSTTGQLYNSGASGSYKFTVGIGTEFNGASAATIDTAVNVAQQFLAGPSETQRIVAR